MAWHIRSVHVPVKTTTNPSLLSDLDETSRQALQASLPSAVICTTGVERHCNAQCLQGYVRESMKQMLVALSPNIGVSAQHLLAQYEQLTAFDYKSTAPKQNLHFEAIEVPQAASLRVQLAFQHHCL